MSDTNSRQDILAGKVSGRQEEINEKNYGNVDL
jgi:hypothetical protein